MKKYLTIFQYLFTFTMYFLGAFLLAGALILPFSAIFFGWQITNPQTIIQKSAILALGAGFGFFLFGFILMTETIILRFLLNLKLKEGEYGYFSVDGMKWAFVNAIMLIVNLTFMDFLRLTPLLPLYYKLMGAKIGKRVQINSKGIADVSLLEIGDDSVIGGDAIVICHLAEHGKLNLKKTVIGRKVTVGLGCVIMPGSSIGDGSLIAAKAVLSKNTVVPEKSLFAGTPAKFIKSLGESKDEKGQT